MCPLSTGTYVINCKQQIRHKLKCGIIFSRNYFWFFYKKWNQKRFHFLFDVSFCLQHFLNFPVSIWMFSFFTVQVIKYAPFIQYNRTTF